MLAAQLMRADARAMRSADFKRALAERACSRTEHFALHYVNVASATPLADLSTPRTDPGACPVDGLCRLGLVVPKRLARRAVTRNLIKRHARANFSRAQDGLASGDWLLRLRRTFDGVRFVSASSGLLGQAVAAELSTLFAAAGSRSAAAKCA